MKRLLFVMNPNAGLRQARRQLTDILSRLNRAGYLCSVYITEKRGDAAEIVRTEAGNADAVAACGGDGTLNEVITGLIDGGHRIPLGYFPCGSTNDFASGMGIPTDLMKACDTLTGSEPMPLDAGLFCEKRYFSYTASFGAFTSVSYSTPQNVKNILGHAAYILGGIRSLGEIRPIHLRVSVNGQVYEDDYLFGAVCNSTSLGGVLKLDDNEVHMNDGLFEALLIAFPPDLLAVNRILNALRIYDYSDPALTFLRSDCFTFEGDAGLRWTLDGEEAEGAGTVTIRNLHHALSFLAGK